MVCARQSNHGDRNRAGIRAIIRFTRKFQSGRCARYHQTRRPRRSVPISGAYTHGRNFAAINFERRRAISGAREDTSLCDNGPPTDHWRRRLCGQPLPGFYGERFSCAESPAPVHHRHGILVVDPSGGLAAVPERHMRAERRKGAGQMYVPTFVDRRSVFRSIPTIKICLCFPCVSADGWSTSAREFDDTPTVKTQILSLMKSIRTVVKCEYYVDVFAL